MAWPGRLLPSPQYDDCHFYFAPSSDFQSLVFLTVGDYTTWEGRTIIWRSPLWQFENLPRSRSHWPGHAVRAFTDSEPHPILRLAALQGFWTLDRGWLLQLASHIGCEIPSGASVLDVVHCLCKHLLSGIMSSSDILKRVQGRLQRSESVVSDDCEDLARCDEAVDVLDKRDEDAVRKAQKEYKDKKVLTETFRQSFRQEVDRQHAAPAAGSGEAR